MAAASPDPAEPVVRDYDALAQRMRAAAVPPLRLRVYGQQVNLQAGDPAVPAAETAALEAYDLFMVDVPARVRGARYSVLLNGGTHGDEPAGAEAVVRFLEERRYERWPDVAFTVTPCTNPWGYVHDKREGPGGADLNRSFRRAGPRTRQVTFFKRALVRRRYDLLVDCHEDVDAPGLYVFAPGALGRAIVDAVRAHGPIHEGDLVDGEIPLDGGVVVLDGERMRARRRRFTAWALPHYIGRYHQRAGAPPGTSMQSATVETPTRLPLEQRVAMHHAAIDAALATLSDK